MSEQEKQGEETEVSGQDTASACNDLLSDFLRQAVHQLRVHRYCGDCFPENGWPEVNNALVTWQRYKRIKGR
jgi:hypothetical protein